MVMYNIISKMNSTFGTIGKATTDKLTETVDSKNSSFRFSMTRSNMSKTRASASSQVPNTEKQMKARGRRPSAFICFEVFGTRDEARSPSF